MRTAYVTSDEITVGTGGGAVTLNESEALRSISDVSLILSRANIAPHLYKQPDSPFLFDYFALENIKNQQFDYVHFYGGCFSATVRHLKMTGAKVGYTVAAHDRRLSIEEFQRLGMDYPFHHISDDNLFRIYTEGHRLADLVIAPSNKAAEILKSDVGCENVVIIPHGIEWPKVVKPIPENFDCAYLGATGPDKGLLYLIQAWDMLNYADSRLILAGWGTESLEPFIRQIADKGNFVLLGRVPDVADVYNACSVYVQPSVTEAFGIEILEAMSYGRVVIASEGAGASEVIQDGVDGFVVKRRSPEQIAEKIQWLKENRNQMLEMGQKARQKAKNYTWDKIKRRYIKLWQEIFE